MKKIFFYRILFIIVTINLSIVLCMLAEEEDGINKIIPAAQMIQGFAHPSLLIEDQAGTLEPQVTTAAQVVQELAQHSSLFFAQDEAGTQVPQVFTAAQVAQELSQHPSLFFAQDQAGTLEPQVTTAAQEIQEFTQQPLLPQAPLVLEDQIGTQFTDVVLPFEITEVLDQESQLDQELAEEEIRTDFTKFLH
jgi:hypothetical protein